MIRANDSSPKIRCAIYCRKSTEDGLEQEFENRYVFVSISGSPRDAHEGVGCSGNSVFYFFKQCPKASVWVSISEAFCEPEA